MERVPLRSLRMRKRAQDRKAGLLKNDPKKDEKKAIAAPQPVRRRASVLGSLGLASDSPTGSGGPSRASSFFGSPEKDSTTPTKSNGPGMFSRMASAVGFNSVPDNDDIHDADGFSPESKPEVPPSKKPSPVSQADGSGNDSRSCSHQVSFGEQVQGHRRKEP